METREQGKLMQSPDKLMMILDRKCRSIENE
jgi:hypothetical protein